MTKEEFQAKYHRRRFFFSADNKEDAEKFVNKMNEWGIGWNSGHSLDWESAISLLAMGMCLDSYSGSSPHRMFKRANRGYYTNDSTRPFTEVHISELLKEIYPPTEPEVSLYE